jgi:hypothetical protein
VRKGLKIKAYLILIAWMTIFMHNVIPHNHIEECLAVCQGTNDRSAGDSHVAAGITQLGSQSSESTVCHASSLLFHNLSQENLVTRASEELIPEPNIMAAIIFPVGEQSYFSNHPENSLLFRAPPAC